MAVIFSSNCWAVILSGNVHLSITISVIINLLSWGNCLCFAITIIFFTKNQIWIISVITLFFVQSSELLHVNLYRLTEIHLFNLHQFFIPLALGVMIQCFFPLTTRFAPTVLKMLSPIAVFNLHLPYLLSDLDLFIYGTLDLKVSHE